MSVLFLPPPAGAASIPDASETVKGKIRIATSAEATAGTDDLTSMTPAKVKSVVDAAVAGGVTYKGTFDAAAPLDLSNAVQGDLYIIDGAGTYQGKTWAVGDHLLVNADMGGTVDPAKIDKIDSTDSVTSVAGRTGAVVLSTADISGLATVATTGAYSDLSGTPSLATVATTGAYSDLSGTPSLATVATTGAYSDLSGTPDIPDFQTITVNSNTTLSSSLEDGCYLIMIGSAATVTIPAYPTGKSLVFRFVSFGAGTCTIQQASGGTRLYEFGNSGITGVNSVNVASGATRTFHLWAAGSTVALNYWSEASPSSTSATVAALDDIGDVTITTPANTQVIKYNSTSGDWENGAVAYADVSGTPSLATVATTGAYSDLSGTPTLATVATTGAYSDLSGLPTLGTAAALDVGTSATNVVQLDGSARLPAVDGSQLTNLPSGASTLGALTDVTITSVANTQVIKYNSTSGDWENGAVAYADVSGTPTLATVATTGAYSDLSGTPTLATVATTGAYSDLSGLPTLGTAAALDVGTSANNVVQLNGSAQLPAVDGSQLTGISATVAALNDIGDVSAASPNNGDVIAYNSTSGDWEATAQSGGGGSAPSVTVSSPSTTQTLSAPSGIEEVYIYTPSASINVNLVAAATCGSGFKYQIKNRSTNTININPHGSETIDGAANFSLGVQNSSLTIICDGSNWFVI
jgi:hypothetical protein